MLAAAVGHSLDEVLVPETSHIHRNASRFAKAQWPAVSRMRLCHRRVEARVVDIEALTVEQIHRINDAVVYRPCTTGSRTGWRSDLARSTVRCGVAVLS